MAAVPIPPGQQQLPASYQNQQVPYGEAGMHDDDLPKPKKTISVLGKDMNKDLFVSKLFYLFFYSSFGSLFPLIAIYFKQLGLSPLQTGILIGIRPFVEFISAPFWSTFADKFRQGKPLMLFCLLCWLLSTIALNQVHPTTRWCIYEMDEDNGTSTKVYMEDVRLVEDESNHLEEFTGPQPHVPAHFSNEHGIFCGQSPITVSTKTHMYPPEVKAHLVHPVYSTRVYFEANVQESFILLLLIIILGEFFGSPATAVADGLTVEYLKDDPNEIYAKQRMWGSVGWAVAMFLIGLILQGSKPSLAEQECKGLEAHEKNYTVCFTAFGILMFLALVTSAFFTFPESDTVRGDEVAAKLMDVNNRRIDTTRAAEARSEGPQDATESVGPQWIGVLRTFSRPHHLMFLFVCLWMGVGVGVVFSFLFWHLQEIGGGPNLFGLASVVNHISEICAYFFAVDLINKIGHIKVLYVGLLANVFRFVYVAAIPNAWLVLPIELVQGLTHATVWSACSSYISLACPPELKPSAQRLLSIIYSGIGKGLGTILAGITATFVGTRIMFIIYASGSLVILILFFLANRIFKVAVDAGAGTTTAASVGDTHLAPHGIPSAQFAAPKPKKQQYEQIEPNEPAYDPTQEAYDKYVSAGR